MRKFIMNVLQAFKHISAPFVCKCYIHSRNKCRKLKICIKYKKKKESVSQTLHSGALWVSTWQPSPCLSGAAKCVYNPPMREHIVFGLHLPDLPTQFLRLTSRTVGNNAGPNHISTAVCNVRSVKTDTRQKPLFRSYSSLTKMLL